MFVTVESQTNTVFQNPRSFFNRRFYCCTYLKFNSPVQEPDSCKPLRLFFYQLKQQHCKCFHLKLTEPTLPGYSMLPPIPGRRAVVDPDLMNENPFRLPTDDQIFRMREDERKDKEHSKDFNMSLKVWERSKKEVLSASERLREIVGRWWCIVIMQVIL